ncbi:MAG TPA: PorP/SprF family type IX secretion system membrane protein [Ferruginibacter sp.]|nr:PorP/SprF family type IX secretion system membrane protein [Ferruginibacter sp.]
MKSTLFMLIFTLSTACSIWAQDLHFSQFFNAPLTTNPANTGFIPDADYRIGVHYRNQWSSILAAPYKTVSAFGDAQVLRNKIENGWLGLGAYILSDVAGSGTLRSTQVYGSLAYHQMLGRGSLVTAGFNLGWANKQIDASKLTFPDQFNGTFFDNTIQNNDDILNKTNISYFDMQAGVNYAYFPTQNVYINIGYSIQHVNSPKESFYTNNAGNSDSKIPIRHIVFLSAILKPDDKVIISPNAYFSTQANATELMFGLHADYNLEDAGNKQLIIGTYYRWGDAAIAVAGIEINHIRFTFSYDITTSALGQFNNSQGASEFNLLKKGFYADENTPRQALCPEF